MPSPRILNCFTLAGLFLLIAVPSPVRADTTWDARGEWLHLPAGEKIILPVADLLANDFDVPGGSFTVSLIAGPAAVSAVPAGVANRLVIDAEALTYGEIVFTYELESTVGASARVESVVSLVPAIQPVAGDWGAILPASSEKGFSRGGCAIGDGAEIGWYQSRVGAFTLCDFDGTRDLKRCAVWMTPEAANESANESATFGGFRLARVADWDGDGVDEPALYDPAVGELQTYDYTFCGGDSCVLQAGPVLNVGDAGVMPLFGDWRSAGLEVATYRLLTGQLTGPDGAVIPFAAPTAAAQPVAGGWAGTSLDALGLWHDATAELHHLADSGGVGGGVLTALMQGLPARGFAFAGRWSDCGVGGDFLGLFDPGRDLLTLVPIASDSWLRGLHVKVVVDPGTGGGD